MVSFGLEVTKPEAINEILNIRTRLLVDDFVKNPFQGKITAHGKNFFTVILEPIYPAFYLGSIFPFFSSMLFHQYAISKWLVGLGFIMLGGYIFWWDRFYFLLFWYKTKRGVRYVSPAECLKRVV